MHKAIFFSGYGTVYTSIDGSRENKEVFPETLPALRFLKRRGFLLVLVTPGFQEYKWLQASLKDRTLSMYHWDVEKVDLDYFLDTYDISIEDSYFITDGLYLKSLQGRKNKLILVLSGRGVQTLNLMTKKDQPIFDDICKDIYAAAFSIALDR